MATTITPTIVTVDTTVTAAPTPSQLQQSGALISVGGTTLTTNDYQFCGDLSTLEGILATSGTGNSDELKDMGTTFFAQGSAVGVYVLELGTATDADAGVAALTTWLTNNPGVFYAFLVPADWGDTLDEVGSVTITNGGTGYTSAPTVTFSAPTSGTTATGTATIQNGVVVSVTITDPGSGYTTAPTVTFSAPTSGTTAAGTANLVSAMNILASDYANPNSQVYFFITDVTADASLYEPSKSAFVYVNGPTAPSTEFGTAAPFYQWLVNNPNSDNRLAPMGFRFLYGVTPWVKSSNATNINTILTAYGNLTLTGAEGGISTASLFKGTLGDGSQASAWYGMDWLQIQIKQALANLIINGSNSNPPLLYDQAGINTLRAKAQSVANTAVTNGCVLSATVSAVPFSTYSTNNPSDYKAGIYNGLSCTAVFQNGFESITFYLDAVQFAS